MSCASIFNKCRLRRMYDIRLCCQAVFVITSVRSQISLSNTKTSSFLYLHSSQIALSVFPTKFYFHKWIEIKINHFLLSLFLMSSKLWIGNTGLLRSHSVTFDVDAWKWNRENYVITLITLYFKNEISISRYMVPLNNEYEQDILILAKTMKCCERIFFIAVH